MSKNSHDNNKNNVRIHEDAKEFSKLSFKKYKKKYGSDYDRKKECQTGFYLYLFDLLPRTIEFCVKYGYINDPEIQEVKNGIYAKIVDEDFVKYLKKEIKGGNKIENIKWMPIIISDILKQTNKQNTEMLAQDPNAKIYDMSDLVELSQIILKKKLKKFNKFAIENNIAFDILSVIPTDNVLNSSQNYRIATFMSVLYEHAKTEAIPFKSIMEVLVGDEYYPIFIIFTLLERKEKFGQLNDSQKAFYLEVTNWIFDTMENQLSKEQLNEIIRVYINARKRDDSKGTDTNRRYQLSSLVETDFPKITSVVKKFISNDAGVAKYL